MFLNYFERKFKFSADFPFPRFRDVQKKKIVFGVIIKGFELLTKIEKKHEQMNFKSTYN